MDQVPTALADTSAWRGLARELEATVSDMTWANQQSCEAINRWKTRAESAETELAAVRAELEEARKDYRTLFARNGAVEETRDYWKRRAEAAESALVERKADGENGWCYDMSKAPRDATLLKLLIAADDARDHALEDTDGLSRTVGHNNFDHDGVDEWVFAGWSWEQDCHCVGEGNPVAWCRYERPSIMGPDDSAIDSLRGEVKS